MHDAHVGSGGDAASSAPPLDIEIPEQLTAYLRRTGRIAADEQPRIVTLAGGVSNRTVLVERTAPGASDRWVLKQSLEKLRVAADWYSDPARIHHEALGLQHLPDLAPSGAITPLVFEDFAHHLLAMQAVPPPHENWKTLLLAGVVESDHVRQFAELLASIHRRSAEQADRYAPLFDERSIFESLRLEPYYAYTAQQVPAAADFLHDLLGTTRGRRIAIVHGDFSPKNVLVHQGRLILLDHEVIHFGDPAFDLGFAMTHFLSKAHHLPAHRAAFATAAAQFWRVYAADGELEPHAVRHTLGCLLGRVRGRSPLEYLDEVERARQATVVVGLMADPPSSVPDLIDRFVDAIH